MQGAIFDMDGLLLDTERVWQRVWRELAASRGITLDDRFTTAICGTAGKEEEDILRRFIPGAKPSDLMDQARRRVWELEECSVPLKPGAVELLEGLKGAGFPIAVASSSPADMISRNLAKAGISDFFSVLTSGTLVPRAKPAPDVFLLAAEKLGLNPEVCYVFEDSFNGVRAGHAAGCVTVMVPDLVQPTEEIRSLCALVATDLAAAWKTISTQIAH